MSKAVQHIKKRVQIIFQSIEKETHCRTILAHCIYLRLVSVSNIEYFRKNQNLESKTKTEHTKVMFCMPDYCLIFLFFLDQGQETNYFCWISLVMHFVYYNDSNAGPES